MQVALFGETLQAAFDQVVDGIDIDEGFDVFWDVLFEEEVGTTVFFRQVNIGEIFPAIGPAFHTGPMKNQFFRVEVEGLFPVGSKEQGILDEKGRVIVSKSRMGKKKLMRKDKSE